MELSARIVPEDKNNFAVNGSLWTVRIEFRWYLYLLALGIMTRIVKPQWRRMIFLAAIAILGCYYFAFYHAQAQSERSWTLDYGMYFCLGALMYLYHDQWKMIYWLFALVAGAVAYFLGQAIMAALLIIVPSVIVFGRAATPIIKDAGRLGDFSYGVYIYAFMLQQTLVWYFADRLSFTSHLMLVTVMTFICAFLSWHLVEKPALSLKKHLPGGR